ncbi:MAG: aminopeptidase P family protein [Chloroflexi bacterium]|nr:MAG: aminopeptidase P family protein [Chloroflexota bacterium]
MKRDLDRLMAERGIDAAVVMGGVRDNPTMYYLTNGAKLTHATVIKRRGEAPVLFHASMERDEAAKSGLTTRDLGDYNFRKIMEEAQGDRLQATVLLYTRLFEELGVQGRVAFYGRREQGASYAFLRALDAALPQIEVVGEFDNDIFAVAQATKDADEVARIREVGRRASQIMADVVRFLRRHPAANGALVREDGSPLTVGDVKQFVRARLFENRLEDPEEMIFAIGRDAGVPHSHGEDDAPLRLGQTIVFDLFPQEAGGGYFFDMTRTFCLGYAPPEVERAYQDVLDCFNEVVAALRPGTATRQYQVMACELFETRGHPTVKSDPTTKEGYVHSLGHGLGLEIHGRPTFADVPGNEDTLQPGVVFTIEPGLYYPERGFGIRIEDTFWLDEEGRFHNLTDFPKALVIPIAGA